MGGSTVGPPPQHVCIHSYAVIWFRLNGVALLNQGGGLSSCPVKPEESGFGPGLLGREF